MTRNPGQASLFGGVEPPRNYDPPRQFSPKACGYAAPPGTGPDGESCGTCTHCRVRTLHGRHFYKCGLMIAAWNTDRSTDVVLKSPACRKWEKGQPSASHISRLHDRGRED